MVSYIWRAVKAPYRLSAVSNAPETAQAKIYSVFDVLPFLSIPPAAGKIVEALYVD
jgi:hypothetical protein